MKTINIKAIYVIAAIACILCRNEAISAFSLAGAGICTVIWFFQKVAEHGNY